MVGVEDLVCCDHHSRRSEWENRADLDRAAAAAAAFDSSARDFYRIAFIEEPEVKDEL